MNEPFSAYPALLHCGIYRPSIDSLPVELSALEQELQAVVPPHGLADVHCVQHLASFARHVADLVADPIRRVEVDGRVFHAILGVVVYHRDTDGTFHTALWQRPKVKTEGWLIEFISWETPVLAFPSTQLWHQKLRQAFVSEAQQRLEDLQTGEDWAQWAWSIIQERIIDPIDLRRLRSRIRAGLALDLQTVSLMLWSRRFDGDRCRQTVTVYNNYRRGRDVLFQLKECSLLFPLLVRWLTLPKVGARGSTEASARLKQACLELGVKPAQWRLLAAPDAPLMPLWKIFIREFMREWHREPTEDFLRVISLLKPNREIDPDVWRIILSMAGTRVSAPESYANNLVPVCDTLRHIIRLLETGKAPQNRDQRIAELHEICAWVADTVVKQVLPRQRRRGWVFLVRSARTYAEQRERALQLESLQWSVPLHPVTVGDYTVVPLTCGRDLWAESIAMRHCADLYGERCKSGTTLVLSVRDADGHRRATVALEKKKGDWTLAHAVGPANRQLGKEFDQVINTTLSLLSVMESNSPSSVNTPRYRIDVLDNFEHGESWSDNTFRSAEAALGAARRICKSGLPSCDEAGRQAWLLFGEAPIIMALNGAAPVEFEALNYVNKLCKLQQHS
jgi:hypothetical protein